MHNVKRKPTPTPSGTRALKVDETGRHALSDTERGHLAVSDDELVMEDVVGTTGDEDSPLLRRPRLRQSCGLGFYSATSYVVSLTGILPMLALPGAFAVGGYPGIFFAAFLVMTIWFTELELTETWALAEKFYPDIAKPNSRHPWGAIAEAVGGRGLRRAVRILLDIELTVAAVPFLLLASSCMQYAVNQIGGGNLSFCYWLIVLVCGLLPLSWLATPADLRTIAWSSCIFMLLTSLSLMYIIIKDIIEDAPLAPAVSPIADLTGTGFPLTLMSWPTWAAAAYAFGAITFQFNVHPIILSVQGHMKHRKDITHVLYLSFCGVSLLYGPVVGLAYFRYGSTLSTDLFNNLGPSLLLTIIALFVVAQILLSFILGVTVLFLDLEQSLGIPNKFGCMRVALRTFVLMFILFLCETLPMFSVVIQLIGGALVMPLIFILPVVFKLVLKQRCLKRVDCCELVVSVLVVSMGVVGGISSVVATVDRLSLDILSAQPCYVKLM